jgi:hypothetical protein
MAIDLNDNLGIKAPKPVDGRTQVANLTALTQLNVSYNHNTMVVWVKSEKAWYYLKDNTTGVNVNDWEKLASGGPTYTAGDGIDTTNDTLSVDVAANGGLDFASDKLTTKFNTAIADALETTNTVGSITAGTPASTLKTKTLVELVEDILFPIVAPTYTPPTATLVVTPTGLRELAAADISVAGTGGYNQQDAGAWTEARYLKNDTTAATIVPNDPLTYAETITKVAQEDPTFVPQTISYQLAIDHAIGAVKNNSRGVPDATGQIAAGTITSPIGTIKMIYPYFYGTVPSAQTTLVSNDITGGTKVVAECATTVTIAFNNDPNGTTRGWVAFPTPDGNQAVNNFTKWQDTNNLTNKGVIGTSTFNNGVVIPVTINGKTHNYTYYLTSFGTGLGTISFGNNSLH